MDDCDVVVVGSGAGGCVAAHTLAQAGYSVIVVEKGAYLPPSQISLQEADSMDRQFEQHGLLQTACGSITILAGSGVGGGTAINWSCCLPLPETVRREWSHEHGLTDFCNSEYEQATQHVLEKLGATENDKVQQHNAMNQAVVDACRALNYSVETTGQSMRFSNSNNKQEALAAGYIGMGDRYGLKRGGGVQAFLEEAVQTYGLRIVDQCRVDKVITETTRSDTTTTTATTNRRATGVACTVRGTTQLTIRARRAVIVAAGALHTPCLLRRSQFQNQHLGRHLRLHPVAGCIGLVPVTAPFVDSFRGAPMTTVSNQFANLDNGNDGYGCKLEVPVNYPGLSSAAMNWLTPYTFRRRLRRYRHWMPLLLIQRDSGDGGSVHADRRDGSLVLRYRMQPRDCDSLVRGLQGAAAVLEQAGAEEIATAHTLDLGWKPAANSDDDSDDKRNLRDYQASIRERGIQNHKMGLFSAHQMGTCRLSTSSKMGAVDPNGEMWECDNLYVMDASVFPTASGANPMTTVMSISYMLSRRLALRLQYEQQQQQTTNDVAAAKKNIHYLSDEDRAKAQALAEQRQEMRSNDYIQSEKRRVLRSLVRTVGAVALPIVSAIVVARLIRRKQ